MRQAKRYVKELATVTWSRARRISGSGSVVRDWELGRIHGSVWAFDVGHDEVDAYLTPDEVATFLMDGDGVSVRFSAGPVPDRSNVSAWLTDGQARELIVALQEALDGREAEEVA